MWCDVMWCDVMWCGVAWRCVALCYVTLRYFKLRFIPLRYFSLRNVALLNVTLPYDTIRNVTLRHVTSHYVSGWINIKFSKYEETFPLVKLCLVFHVSAWNHTNMTSWLLWVYAILPIVSGSWVRVCISDSIFFVDIVYRGHWSELGFGCRMPFPASISCRSGKRDWNLGTSSTVVEFPYPYTLNNLSVLTEGINGAAN